MIRIHNGINVVDSCASVVVPRADGNATKLLLKVTFVRSINDDVVMVFILLIHDAYLERKSSDLPEEKGRSDTIDYQTDVKISKLTMHSEAQAQNRRGKFSSAFDLLFSFVFGRCVCLCLFSWSPSRPIFAARVMKKERKKKKHKHKQTERESARETETSEGEKKERQWQWQRTTMVLFPIVVFFSLFASLK